MRHPTHLGALVLLAGATAGCPSLAEIPLDVCGNGVVEAELGEECDTPPDGSAETTLKDGRTIRCAGPTEASACHYVWSEDVCCPIHASPGIDGQCRYASRTFGASPATTLPRPARRAQAGDLDGDEWPELLLEFDNNDLAVISFEPGGGVRAELALQRTQETRPLLGALGATVDRTVGICSGDTAPLQVPGSNALILPSSSGARVFVGEEGPALLPKAVAAFNPGAPSRAVALPLGTCLPPVAAAAYLPGELTCPGVFTPTKDGLSIYSVTLGIPDAFFGTDPVENPEGAVVRRHLFEGEDLARLSGPPVPLRLPGWAGCSGMAAWLGGGDDELGGTVHILGFCDPELPLARQFRARELATFDLGENERPFVTDVTGDDEPDLVIASGAILRVLTGDGAGAFEQGDALPIVMPIVDATPQAPIAVGHFDDDDVVDVAQPFAVWSSAGTCAPELDRLACAWTFVAAHNARWSEALVTDLNGDGRSDLIGARSSQAGGDHAVDVLLGGISRILDPIAYSTENAAQELTIEDFDGDGVRDLAYVVPSASGDCTLERDQVFVIFGGTPPSPAVRVAELAGVQNIAAGPLLFAPDAFDGIGDMGIATACPSATTPGTLDHTIAILLGTSRRLLESPFPFEDAVDDARSLFATGDVTGDGQLDLVVASPLGDEDAEADGASSAPLGLWVVPATGRADVKTLEAIGPLELPTAMPRLTGGEVQVAARFRVLQRAAVAVGELDCTPGAASAADPDPRCVTEEAVVFLSAETLAGDAGDTSSDAPRLFVRPGDGSAIQAFPAEPLACGLEGGLSTLVEEVPGTGPIGSDVMSYAFTGKRTEATLVDVDGDGLLDVVGWWQGPRGDPAQAKLDTPEVLAGGAVVFWNDQGFGARCPVRLPVPEGEVIVRVAALRGGLLEPTLVVATDRAVRILRPGLEERLDACVDADEDSRCLPIVAVGDGVALGPIRDVAVIDADQDGLDDLAILREGGVTILHQSPRDEASASPDTIGTED